MTTSLAELIGATNPGEDTRLRQAIVVGAPAGGLATIRFGGTDTADNIAGVHMLASAVVVDGDTVWVLQTGGALLIIGRVSATGGSDAVPVGSITAYWGTVAPAGWLLCNGGSFSAGTYPVLAALLGGTNTPNLKGRVIVGIDPGQAEFDGLGEAGGVKTVTLATTDIPAHNHAVTVDTNNFDTGGGGGHFHIASIGNVGYNFASHSHNGRPGYASEAPWEDFRSPGTAIPVNVATEPNHAHAANHDHAGSSSNAGGGGAHSNLQPYAALSYIIKAS